MAEITAALVKEKLFREMTGAGMMECKKALVEAEGDIDKAVDVLRTRGLAAVAKKAGCATNEGAVTVVIAADGKSGAMVESTASTHFVAMNDKFSRLMARKSLTLLLLLWLLMLRLLRP